MSSPDAEPEADIASVLKCVESLIARSLESAASGDQSPICSPEVVQKVLELGTRLHSAEMQAGRRLPAFVQDHGVAATDVMITTTSMLKAVNIQLFELGMWQMWATVK